MKYSQNIDTIIEWSRLDLIEVTINPRYKYEDVKETLTRMGVLNEFKKLTQTCHILYMGDKFYIVHFKELFGLDTRDISFTQNDANRRTTIAKLLEQWKMITIVNPENIDSKYQRVEITVISKDQVFDYVLSDKYTLNQVIPEAKQQEAPRKLMVV